jgi:hypothetical protein
MDWDLAIQRNSEALNGIVDTLFAMLGLVGDATLLRISQPLYRAVLRVLRPAESAVRRLIVIAARGLEAKAAPSRQMPRRRVKSKAGTPSPSFQLFDPRKNFRCVDLHDHKTLRNPPRIHFFGSDPLVSAIWSARPSVVRPAAPADGLVNAARLGRRLHALARALDDLPRQARRLARWRRHQASAKVPKFRVPLRPGPPPGHRRKSVHIVDDVLAECHGLARDAMRHDTS